MSTIEWTKTAMKLYDKYVVVIHILRRCKAKCYAQINQGK